MCAKLRGGQPHTVVCQGFPHEPDYERLRHRENRDLLRADIVTGTVFVVGSEPAFQAGGQELRQLVEDCPQHMHENPGTHCCAEITEDRQHWKWLHVMYCDEHRLSTR